MIWDLFRRKVEYVDWDTYRRKVDFINLFFWQQSVRQKWLSH